jgi:RNA ligase (TIGR02306 family)
MSTFKVSIETIASIEEHPQADRLEIASLSGMTFQFVVLKGKCRPGDTVVYFPLDAMLPAPLVEFLGLTGRLGGEHRNIICTAKLRGFISQGIVEFPSALADAGFLPHSDWKVGEDLAEALGVTKWVKPPVDVPGATLHDLPAVLSVYDIEGCDRYAPVAELLMDEPVMITEKLEGSNYGIHLDAGRAEVLQRTNSVEEKPGCTVPVWNLARESRFLDSVHRLSELFPNEIITVTGELIGPGCESGNHYKLTEMTARFFDIRRNGQFVDAEELEELLEKAGLPAVPVITKNVTLREWLNGRTIKEAAHGQSLLNPKVLREGIVIKPMREMRDPRIGRLILKQRDPIYLAKTGRG